MSANGILVFCPRGSSIQVDKKSAGGAAAAPKVGGGAFGNARSLFAASDKEGHAFGSTGTVVTVATKHKNAIVNVQLVPVASGNVTKFTTAGIDGRICFWNVQAMNLK
jgi:hypothetical protein